MTEASPPTLGADPRRWTVLGVMGLAPLIVGIDGTIVSVALPSLVRELGGRLEPAAVDRRIGDASKSPRVARVAPLVAASVRAT